MLNYNQPYPHIQGRSSPIHLKIPAYAGASARTVPALRSHPADHLHPAGTWSTPSRPPAPSRHYGPSSRQVILIGSFRSGLGLAPGWLRFPPDVASLQTLAPLCARTDHRHATSRRPCGSLLPADGGTPYPLNPRKGDRRQTNATPPAGSPAILYADKGIVACDRCGSRIRSLFVLAGKRSVKSNNARQHPLTHKTREVAPFPPPLSYSHPHVHPLPHQQKKRRTCWCCRYCTPLDPRRRRHYK